MRIESVNINAMTQLTGANRSAKTDVRAPIQRAEGDSVELGGDRLSGQTVGGGTPIFDEGDDRVHAHKHGHKKSHSVDHGGRGGRGGRGKSMDRGGSVDRGHSIDRGNKYGHNKVQLESTIEVDGAELKLKFKGPVSERSAINMVRKLHHQVDKFLEKNGVDEATSEAAHEIVGQLGGDVFGAVYSEHGDRAALRESFQSAFASFTESLANLFNPEPIIEPGDEQTGEVSLTEQELEGTINTGSTPGDGGVVGSISGGVDLLGTGENVVTGGNTGSTGQLGSGLLLDVTG